MRKHDTTQKSLPQSTFRVWGRRILTAAVWLAIWQGIYLIIGKDIYFPSPAAVARAFFGLMTDGKAWIVIGWSIYRTVLAIFLSTALGIILGMACGLSRALYGLFNPLVVTLKSTPVISVIILATIWFHSTDVPIFSGVLMCFPIVFSGTVAGVRNTDSKLVEMCRFYGVGRLTLLGKLYFRAAAPYINASIVSAVGIAWKAVAAAEVLSMPQFSIGSQLFFAKTGLDMAALFAWTLTIILLSYIFETLYARISGYDKA